MKLEDLFKKTENTQTGPIFTPTSTGGSRIMIAPPGTGTSKIVEVETKPFEIPDYILNDPQQVGYPDKEMQDEIYGWVMEWLSFQPHTSLPYIVKDYGAGRTNIPHKWCMRLEYKRRQSLQKFNVKEICATSFQ
jgi:hypothetical protein